jgi:hypothetical protein
MTFIFVEWCKCTFKKLLKKLLFVASWRSLTKRAGSGSGSGSVSQRYESADPDPFWNFHKSDTTDRTMPTWFLRFVQVRSSSELKKMSWKIILSVFLSEYSSLCKQDLRKKLVINRKVHYKCPPLMPTRNNSSRTLNVITFTVAFLCGAQHYLIVWTCGCISDTATSPLLLLQCAAMVGGRCWWMTTYNLIYFPFEGSDQWEGIRAETFYRSKK